MSSLTKKTGLLIVLNLFKYAVGFLVPMILVRLLDKSDYGTYQQLLLVGTMTVGLMTLGFPASIYYFYKTVDGIERRRAFVLQILLLFATSGIITAAGVFILRDFIAEQMNNPVLSEYLFYYCVYIAFFLAGEYFIHLQISKDKYSLAVKIESGEVIYRVSLLVLPLLLGYGMRGIVWSLGIYAASRFLFYTFVIRRDIFPIPKNVSNLFFFREQLAYSLPLAISSLLGLIGRSLDRVLISINFTTSQLATYAVGAIEIPLDVIFQSSVANVLRASLPELVRKNEYEEIIRIWRAAVRKLALIILPFFVFLMAFAYQFVTVLFTKEYADSVSVFRIYLMLVPLQIFVLSVMLQVFGRTQMIMKVVAICVAFNLITSTTLVYTVGYYGPPVATVLTNYLASVLYFVIVTRLLSVSVISLIPLKSVGRVLVGATLSILIVYSMLGSLEPTFWTLALSGALYFIGYGLSLFLLGEVHMEEVRALLRAVGWSSRGKTG